MVFILFGILFFGFLIAIHEFGHFITAKLSGVRVNEFSIGMGPRLWGRKWGETEYSLRVFPVGGFCAMEGEDGESSDPRSFSKAPFWRKVLILVAGSGMNFLVGLLILVILFSGAEAYVSTTLDSFMEGCPAAEEGYLLPGDELLQINGSHVFTRNDVSLLLSRSGEVTADLVVRRDGEKIKLNDVPMALREYETEQGARMLYGLNFKVTESNLIQNVGLALKSTASFTRLVWYGLLDLISGAMGLNELAGPIGVVGVMTEAGKQAPSIGAGLINLLYFGSFIAINLAVMNLLPIPALDGGRLFFLVLNSLLMLLFRRKIPDQYEGYVHMIGLALLLLLMLLVGISDIYKLIGK